MNVDEHRISCAYRYWRERFSANSYLLSRVMTVERELGPDFTRSELVRFYRKAEVPPETKFVAAMIWGNEAPDGSRRDARGPWKLSRMFADTGMAEQAIRSVSILSRADIVKSYNSLNKSLHRCGPNFFTKHFYFLGKASGLAAYPLIFDDRVARGIVKIGVGTSWIFGLIQVSAQTSADAYLRYLDFVHGEAKKIGCEPDKVEYYLFTR
jgi:hypothetical protein